MDDLIIRTHSGLLEGIRENGVRAWKGIPFAEPPVGRRRFRKPIPAGTWEGIKKSDQPGPLAPQPVDPAGGIFRLKRTGIPQSEDCLYVNVWAPQTTSDEPLPVMVWIHGGTFVTGGGGLPIYDSSMLARRGGVIAVTLSYRLGALGFLPLSLLADAPEEDGFISNAGLLDQIAGLEWVRDNISAFGGDPSRVTVFGESAGSMSIAALLSMPAAKGLFQRAIMQSGASQAMSAEQGAQLAYGFLQTLGIGTGELDRLAELPTEEIMRASEAIFQAAGADAVLLFQPVVDGRILSSVPLDAVCGGAAAGVDIIIGTNREEGALFIHPEAPLLSLEQTVQAYSVITGNAEAKQWIAGYPFTVEGHQQMMTDIYFWRSSVLFANAQLPHSSVWMYRYDYTVAVDSVLGQAFHSAEIPFVFHNLELLEEAGFQVDAEMRCMSERIQDAWIAFARNGNPSTSELRWPAYEADQRATLIFEKDSHVELDPDAQKRLLLTEA